MECYIWVESYLTDQVQRVKLNNLVSPYMAKKVWGATRVCTRANIVQDICINTPGYLLDKIQIYADDALIYTVQIY